MRRVGTTPSLFSLVSIALVSSVLAALAACGGAADTSLLDPAGNGGPDAGVPRPDTGLPDVRRMDDASPPEDVTVHDGPGLDSNPPPPTDAGHPDTAPPKPSLPCGSTTCPVPDDICCAHTAGYPKSYTCEASSDYKTCIGSGGTGGGSAIFCAVPEDCPGKICCGTKNMPYGDAYTLVACSDTCPDTSTHITFCDPSGPSVCAYPETCNASSILLGYYVCE